MVFDLTYLTMLQILRYVWGKLR